MKIFRSFWRDTKLFLVRDYFVNNYIIILYSYFSFDWRAGEAINCFVCSTDTDRRCDDPMNMTRHSIEDCSKSPHSTYLQPVCKKQKQRGIDIFISIPTLIKYLIYYVVIVIIWKTTILIWLISQVFEVKQMIFSIKKFRKR